MKHIGDRLGYKLMHAAALSLANLHQAGRREEITMLPRVYTSVPLTLLVSKQFGPKIFF